MLYTRHTSIYSNCLGDTVNISQSLSCYSSLGRNSNQGTEE